MSACRVVGSCVVCPRGGVWKHAGSAPGSLVRFWWCGGSVGVAAGGRLLGQQGAATVSLTGRGVVVPPVAGLVLLGLGVGGVVRWGSLVVSPGVFGGVWVFRGHGLSRGAVCRWSPGAVGVPVSGGGSERVPARMSWCGNLTA